MWLRRQNYYFFGNLIIYLEEFYRSNSCQIKFSKIQLSFLYTNNNQIEKLDIIHNVNKTIKYLSIILMKMSMTFRMKLLKLKRPKEK